MTQAEIQRAYEVGLIDLDGTDILVRTPEFLDFGPEIAKRGIPVSVMLEEYEAMRTAISKIAKRFEAVFDEHLWSEFEADGMAADDIPALTETATQLAQLATASMTAGLNAHFAEFVEKYVSQATSDAPLL